MKKIVYTKSAPEPIGPYNQAVQSGNMLFVSGQIPINPQTGKLIEGNIAEKTTQVLQNINTILEKAGFCAKDVVKVSVFIKDISKFPEINQVYATFFTEEAPAREVASVVNLPMNSDLMISVIAMI